MRKKLEKLTICLTAFFLVLNSGFCIQENRENWNISPRLSSPTDSWQITWDYDFGSGIALDPGLGTEIDSGLGIALDSAGNIIICGTTGPSAVSLELLLVKFNSSGHTLWNKTRYGFPREIYLVLDSSNNIFVTGSDFVAKFDIFGIYQWNTSAGVGAGTKISAITIDTSGNLYIVGTTGIDPIRDVFVVKFNSAGVKQWEYVYPDDPILETDIALDSSNNIFVIGDYKLKDDIMLLKLSNSGSLLWELTLVNSGIPCAMVLDSANNIFITGNSQSDVLLIKCNSLGTVQWTRKKNLSKLDTGYDISLDSMDNIYIATDTNFPNDPDIIKYDSSGNYLGRGISKETLNVENAMNIRDHINCIAIDSDDNVYLGGYFSWYHNDGFSDIKLIKNLAISLPSPGIPSYNIFVIVGLISIISIIVLHKKEKHKEISK